MNDFLTALFKLLNRQYTYAVLRNFEGLPEHNSSRDIDILILRRDLKKLKADLKELTLKTDNSVFYCQQDHQFFTFVAGNAQNGLIQLDFQYNFAWMGIDLLDERKVLTKRVFNGKVYHLPPDLTFLPKYLYSRILGAEYPQKYHDVLEKAFGYDKENIDFILKEISLGKDFDYWEKAGKYTLRFRGFISALLHRPYRAIAALINFIWCYVSALFFRRGLLLSFSGPDGCGKTTVIEMLRERLKVNPPVLFHFRPALLPNLGEAAHKAGVIKEVDRNFDKPHRAKKKGVFNSLIRLAYYASDYIIGYYVKILPLRQRKRIVFFDRYFTDIIVDSERSSIFLNCKFLTFLRHFIPKCQYNFIFKVDPETIRSRKQELEIQDMERIYTRLEYLASKDKSYYWIDNNTTPEAAVEEILNVLIRNLI